MLALRLIRGAGPRALALRLLVTLTSGAVGLLLLAAMDRAPYEPYRAGAAVPLLWCLPALAALVWLAAGVSRNEAEQLLRSALGATGRGRRGTALLAALPNAAAALLGTAVAVTAFLALRSSGPTAVHSPLGPGGASLPLPAVPALLLVLPLAAGCAGALALRTPVRRPNSALNTACSSPAALAVAAGSALAGLALSGYAERAGKAVWPGWSLIALGFVLAGPALTALAGRALTRAHPGPLRLLAGRALLAESTALGGPLGVLAALLWAAATAALHHGATGIAPHTALAGGVVLVCAAAGTALAARRPGPHRAATTAALHSIGAPASLPRRTAAVRTGALLAVFLPVCALLTALAGLPG